jgi:hypothetical protein
MADQQPAPGSGFSKRHVSGMLKHLADDEQRAKAQEVAAVYKKLFAEKKWEAVLGKMQRVVDEDNLRVLEKRRPARLLQAGQALFAKSPMNTARTTPRAMGHHIARPRDTTIANTYRQRLCERRLLGATHSQDTSTKDTCHQNTTHSYRTSFAFLPHCTAGPRSPHSIQTCQRRSRRHGTQYLRQPHERLLQRPK